MAESQEVRDWIALAQRDPRAWLYEADRLKRAADLVGSRFQGEANEWLKLALLEGEEEEGREQAGSRCDRRWLLKASRAPRTLRPC